MNDNNKPKARYKVRNWSAYNRGLRERGSITIWLSEEARAGWYTSGSGKRGHPLVYADMAIEAVLTIRSVFGLPLRASQGLVDSLLRLMGSDLKCPDYSTLSRRGGKLSVRLPPTGRGEAVHLAIDSTGLKVYGEGEWKVRKHGAGKRRTWRKLHLAVDVDTGEILAHVLTQNDVGDSEVFSDLLAQIDRPIASVSGDGAYDTKECHQAIADKKAIPKIPPRRGATVQCPQLVTSNTNPALAARDSAIRRINALGGEDDARKQWKIEVGYHRRSLAETAMFRRKTLFSPKLSSRKLPSQKQESALIIRAMNTMTTLAKPLSYKAAS